MRRSVLSLSRIPRKKGALASRGGRDASVENMDRIVSRDNLAQNSNEKPMTKKKGEEKSKMTYLDVAKNNIRVKARRLEGNGEKDRLTSEN